MAEHDAHHHHHGHHHGDDFDWDAMADRLVLDAAIVMPIVTQVLAALPNVHDARTVLDLGCGPGVVACALAEHLPLASVTAMDTSDALLHRTRHAAAAAGVQQRVHTTIGDLEADLDALPVADLAWAGMVVHHVADPVATLRRIHHVLRPGGTLVMIEFGRPPELHEDGTAAVNEAWARFESATSAVLAQRLGLDPVTVDWPTLLRDAGFTDVTDDERTAHHPAPLAPSARQWFDAHVRRGIEMAGDQVEPDDAAALLALADDVADGDTTIGVAAHRRVLTARRP